MNFIVNRKIQANRQLGFTLIELMITVVIIGIIAAFAYPSYLSSVSKSRRSECQGDMLAFANALERYNSANGSYTGASTAVFADACPVDSITKNYTLAVNVPAGGSAYTITAAPTGPHTGDKCGSLTLSQTGARGVSGNTLPINLCWE